jgi:succinate-acetate transporter protein
VAAVFVLLTITFVLLTVGAVSVQVIPQLSGMAFKLSSTPAFT